jgi:hypothetical protein
MKRVFVLQYFSAAVIVGKMVVYGGNSTVAPQHGSTVARCSRYLTQMGLEKIQGRQRLPTR